MLCYVKLGAPDIVTTLTKHGSFVFKLNIYKAPVSLLAVRTGAWAECCSGLRVSTWAVGNSRVIDEQVME